MLRSDIINFFINKYNYKSYLEIGTYDVNNNFNFINCESKECIDPNPLNPTSITYLMTSDEAFEQLIKENKKYDIIFIDGLHLEEQVDKDISNSLACLNENGTIVLHDCNPPTEIHGGESFEIAKLHYNAWNGTVYKSIVKFNKNNTCCKVLDTDWGCGVIRPSLQTEPIIHDYSPLIMDWDQYYTNRAELLKLVNPAEIHSM